MSAPPYVYRAPETRPERRPQDYYPTPVWVIEAALRLVKSSPDRILDPGAGDGQWGAVARERWPNARIYGIEVREVPISYSVYDSWWHQDFLRVDPCYYNRAFDLVMGNPPYGEAEEFVRRSLALLRPDGELIFLLRLQFLCGQARARGLWREHPPADIAFCAKRVSFYGEGRTGSEDYAVVRWRKNWHGDPRVHWIGVTE